MFGKHFAARIKTAWISILKSWIALGGRNIFGVTTEEFLKYEVLTLREIAFAGQGRLRFTWKPEYGFAERTDVVKFENWPESSFTNIVALLGHEPTEYPFELLTLVGKKIRRGDLETALAPDRRTERERFWVGYEKGLADPDTTPLAAVLNDEEILHGFSMGIAERDNWFSHA